ncbi:hypothetical protein Vau01_046500 [Virgisporangium aurantiacum]|uniref:HTH cro/C1-type domain-containing protein n=1 Tax=Virgisporangium aurantiacum TaxID=175570 RepID=A0A8J3Z4G7_9ACTN|nr:hypothetical protein Vau01_046500 [Virgisporangium aurantiacum]
MTSVGRDRPDADRLPGDLPRRVACEERIAWMLRVNRRYGAQQRFQRLGPFAEAYARAQRRPISVSQLSRWESGHTQVRLDVVRGYEKTLGLPPFTLVGVADAVFRNESNGLALTRLARPDRDPVEAERRMNHLLDRVLSADVMTGLDWDELTWALTSAGRVFLRTSDWRALVNRLLSEQLIASGGAWRFRNESAQRLLWLGSSRPHVIGACADLVRDRRSQIVIEPLVIMDVVDHPEASRLLIEQVLDPASDQALRGALLGSAAHVRLNLFRPEQLDRLGSAIADRLLGLDADAGIRQLAGEVIAELPVPVRTRVVRRIRRLLDDDLDLRHVLTARRTASIEVGNALAARVSASVVARLPDDVDTQVEDVLRQLVTEILCSPNPEARLHAAQLLGATPLADPMADVLCDETARAARTQDGSTIAAVLTALPFLGSARHRRIVEHMVLATGVPPLVRNSAAWNIGHLPGRSTDLFWRQAIARHSDAAHRRPGRDSTALRGLVYSLGITGHETLLATIAADPTMPPGARSAAQWWRDLPGVVSTSAKL